MIHDENQDSLSNLGNPFSMQRCFFALILLVVVSPLTSAEAYTIQGKATYGDNTPVILQKYLRQL